MGVHAGVDGAEVRRATCAGVGRIRESVCIQAIEEDPSLIFFDAAAAFLSKCRRFVPVTPRAVAPPSGALRVMEVLYA